MVPTRQLRRANNFDERAARQARRYLEKLQAELTRRIITNAGTRWDIQHYENVRREVAQLLIEIERTLGAKLQEKIIQASALGDKLALAGLRNVGIKLDRESLNLLTLSLAREASTASATLVRGITDGVRAKIDAEIDQGIQGLKSGIEVIKSIADVKDFTGIALKTATQRAEDIFRTETSRIINMSTISRYREVVDELDEKPLKYWLATQGSRTRDTHRKIWHETDPNIGGTPIPFDSDFVLSDGERAFGPSAPTLSAKNAINCMCRMILITMKQWSKLKGER